METWVRDGETAVFNIKLSLMAII